MKVFVSLIFCYLVVSFKLTLISCEVDEYLNYDSESKLGEIKSLDVFANNGILHVLFADEDKEGNQSFLRYIKSEDNGNSWSKPTQVDEGSLEPYARGRGTDFHIAANENNLVAVWMAKGSGFMGRGPLVTAYSNDCGTSWKPGENPTDDRSDTDHSFIDITADNNGNFHTIWLDKRNGKTKGLYSATSINNGKTWMKNRIVDSASCDCCWNVIVTDTIGNLFSLYRDLNPRDMSLSISKDGGDSWKRLGYVGKFDWDFVGCPHVGGGLATTLKNGKTQLHSLVWTGKEDMTGLYYLQSRKNLKAWSKPQKLGSNTARFPDIAVNDNGKLITVWDDYKEGESVIIQSLSTDNGITWSEPKQISILGRNPTHARVVANNESFHVFWTESVNGKTVLSHQVF